MQRQQCPKAVPTTKLSNGRTLPLLGLGTWKSSPGEVGAAVKEAIKLGYRHLDCAAIYGNEAEIGVALQECVKKGWVRREELFVTSKLWNGSHKPEDVLPALQKTLNDLQLDYLDMYLIHWPVALKKDATFPFAAEDFYSLEQLPISATWAEMEKLVDQGLCRGIGVSNFSVKKMKALLATARIPPAINQVERHPYLQINDVLAFCKSNGIHLTAYSPLGSMDRPQRLRGADMPILLEDATIAHIAGRHRVTPAQVLLQWAIQTGTSTIPKSVKPHRLAENLAALTVVSLEKEDLEQISKLDRQARYGDGKLWCPPGSPYTTDNLWDVVA